MQVDDHKEARVQEEERLSLREAADALGVSEVTARRWVKSGKLKAYQPGRKYLIPRSAIDELLESESGKVQAPSSQEKLFNNGILEEERRARWEAAVEEARRLREGGRARMEELIAAWRDKRDHRALRGMGRLLDEAYDAEAALTHYLEEESTGRIRLDQVPITEWEEVRKASRFYGALVEMVQGAGLRVRTKGKAHEVKDAA
jgi:excisionase family DNA binding protein